METLILFYRNMRLMNPAGMHDIREQVGKVIVDHETLEWQDHDPKGNPTRKGGDGPEDSTGRPHFMRETDSPVLVLLTPRDGHYAYDDDGNITVPTYTPRERATVTYDKEGVSVDHVEPGYSVVVWRLAEVHGLGIVPSDVKADEPESDDDGESGNGDEGDGSMNDDLIREGDKGYQRLYELWHEERERLYDPVRYADGSSKIPVRIPINEQRKRTEEITMKKYGFCLFPDDYSEEWIKDVVSARTSRRIVGAMFLVTDKPKYVQEVIVKLEEGKE